MLRFRPRSPVTRGYERTVRVSTSSSEQLKAVQMLNATTLTNARRAARRELSAAKRCPRCASLLRHMFDRMGSDVFLEDDPNALAQAFESCDCDESTPRVLAAYVVLKGRHRVTLRLAS
jgi:hypothetical protein